MRVRTVHDELVSFQAVVRHVVATRLAPPARAAFASPRRARARLQDAGVIDTLACTCVRPAWTTQVWKDILKGILELRGVGAGALHDAIDNEGLVLKGRLRLRAAAPWVLGCAVGNPPAGAWKGACHQCSQ
eukprot:3996755-Alexandrium_andersonii.AAC.1